MTRRRKYGLALATLFVLVNLGGIVMAGMAGEVSHTTAHAVLAVVGILVTRWLAVMGAPSRHEPHHELGAAGDAYRGLDPAAPDPWAVGGPGLHDHERTAGAGTSPHPR